jgi:hypothetical protein
MEGHVERMMGDDECIQHYHLGETGVDDRISVWIAKVLDEDAHGIQLD